jgi:hypothetical protein
MRRARHSPATVTEIYLCYASQDSRMHGPAARRQIRQAFERVDQPLGLLLDMHRWIAANVDQQGDVPAASSEPSVHAGRFHVIRGLL